MNKANKKYRADDKVPVVMYVSPTQKEKLLELSAVMSLSQSEVMTFILEGAYKRFLKASKP